MLKLKTNVNVDTGCILSAADITGFKSSENLEGFTPEGSALDTVDDYHISDGYFLDALLFEAFDSTITLVNSFNVDSILTGDVSSTYINNFPSTFYQTNRDGIFYFKRLFVISKVFYDANKASGRFDNKTVIYYSPLDNKLYTVLNNSQIEVTLESAAKAYTYTGTKPTTGAYYSTKFVSTCFLNKCFYLLQKKVIDTAFGICTKKGDNLIAERDFISMTINVIKYLKDAGYLTEISRILETVNTCGAICRAVGVETKQDCGCNG